LLDLQKVIFLLVKPQAYCNFEVGELGKAGEILKEQWKNIENLMDTEKFVYATYYRYTALFHLKQDHYSEFYHYSLQFLSYVDQEVSFLGSNAARISVRRKERSSA
jgi:hypothetical protein